MARGEVSGLSWRQTGAFRGLMEFAPPYGQKINSREKTQGDAKRADLTKAGHAGIGRKAQGAKAHDGGGTGEKEGAADRFSDGGEVPLIAAEGKLDVDAIIDTHAQE